MRTDRIGYTMIETVIVMLVMGILAAVIAPKYRATAARYRVEAAARRLVADLSYVRTRAMMKGPVAEELVDFYPASEEYELVGSSDLNLAGNAYRVDFSKTAYPVDLVSATFVNTDGNTNNQTVKFDVYGFPCSGTSPVAPLVSGEIVLAAGSETRTVVIHPLTGKASVQ